MNIGADAAWIYLMAIIFSLVWISPNLSEKVGEIEIGETKTDHPLCVISLWISCYFAQSLVDWIRTGELWTVAKSQQYQNLYCIWMQPSESKPSVYTIHFCVLTGTASSSNFSLVLNELLCHYFSEFPCRYFAPQKMIKRRTVHAFDCALSTGLS